MIPLREDAPLVPTRRDLAAAHRSGGRYSRHLAHRLQRIGGGLRAIEIAAIDERSARVRRGEKNNE